MVQVKPTCGPFSCAMLVNPAVLLPSTKHHIQLEESLFTLLT